MPHRGFIHSTADVAAALLYAMDSGFQVRLDTPQPEPRPHMVTREEVLELTEGVFFAFRPEWVFGPFQTMAISGGHNQGKYFVSPTVNVAPITIYFQGERSDQGKRRFGDGLLSFGRDWLELPAKVVRETPPDVEGWFKRFAAHLFSKQIIKAGVHHYRICKGVMADTNAGQCLPPFDFIPWDRDMFLPHKPSI